MQVMLDDEQWTVNDGTSLMEILAQLSDKAHARQRVVTSLQVGERLLTDRDLTGAVLAQAGAGHVLVRAMTQSFDQVRQGADRTIGRYAAFLKSEGAELVHAIRAGSVPGASLEAWLGRLADYFEYVENTSAPAMAGTTSASLAPWVASLLDAHAGGDVVRLADLIEYEMLPRLPA
jgi:hypothetical protein